MKLSRIYLRKAAMTLIPVSMLFIITACNQAVEFSRGQEEAPSSVKPEPSPTPTPNPTFTPTPTPTPSPSPSPSPLPPGKAQINGFVTNALNGLPLRDVLITLSSLTYPNTRPLQILNMSDGSYSFTSLAAGNYQIEFKKNGFITYSPSAPISLSTEQNFRMNVSLSPELNSDEIRLVLSWNPGPDLDSYLATPDSSIPIYWNNKTGDGANLDIDDTLRGGPETITINTIKTGRYFYYIAIYDSKKEEALGLAKPRVTVYQGKTMIGDYLVPVGVGYSFLFLTIENKIIIKQQKYLGTPIYDHPWWIAGGLKFQSNALTF